MSRPVLEVLDPGLLSTVQDNGRPDAVDLGVPVGGACDPWSLALANVLAGNAADAAALEITLAGPTVRVLADTTVGLAGADFSARVVESGRRLAPGGGYRLRVGQTVRLETAADGTGIRAYLAVDGGIDVPEVLGSRSTCLVGGFGGYRGRALQQTDVLDAGPPAGDASERTIDIAPPSHRLRIVAALGQLALAEGMVQSLTVTDWTVGGRSDRQGIRLDGPRLDVRPESAQMLSQGVVWGAIQLPPDGQPICLLADHQTVGGYPVPAVVATVDLPALGQLGPGDALSFELIDIGEAQRLLRDQASDWAATLAVLAGTG